MTAYGNGDQKTQEEAAAVTNDDDADNNKVGHDDDEDERSRAEPSEDALVRRRPRGRPL